VAKIADIEQINLQFATDIHKTSPQRTFRVGGDLVTGIELHDSGMARIIRRDNAAIWVLPCGACALESPKDRKQ